MPTASPIAAHLFSPGPKRILALDGGGIKGLMSLQLIKKIESILAQRSNTPNDFRLCDYFDLIGGTSTGAILAAGLATGQTADQLIALYNELGNSIFEPAFFRRGLFRAKFSEAPLRKALEREFGEISLGSEHIKTGLAITTKRLDTGSTWILHNNPRGKYFSSRPGSASVPNKDYRLSDIVRASTAAPHYFDGEKSEVASDVHGAFVDGGVSPHNNPALQLLLLATAQGHAFQWRTGAQNLMIVSIGTGRTVSHLDPEKALGSMAAKHALLSLASIMDDCADLVETMMQWFSTSPTARTIDREIGDLKNDLLCSSGPLFSYLRYDAVFDRQWLADTLQLDYPEKAVKGLNEMDNPENMPMLQEIGERAAAHLISPAHFHPGFDLN